VNTTGTNGQDYRMISNANTAKTFFKKLLYQRKLMLTEKKLCLPISQFGLFLGKYIMAVLSHLVIDI
jgi:hypothetical protein